MPIKHLFDHGIGNQLQEQLNCKKNKNKKVENKQYTTIQPMDHWRNQRKNFKKILRQWKQKHDNQVIHFWCVS